ncbi:hypothetical protein [Catellatospora paridis]|uniref:hypothetical protein n=1 Tax=Catellatospora paridis TaxID=1617086 RepID=UPI0012D43AF1|nr:hypothetical protein [Catellatospora paridis]
MRLRYPLAAALGVVLVGGGIALGHGLLADPVATATAGTAATPPQVAAPVTPSGTPASTPAAIPGLAPFVGTWRVHGAELTIKPDGTATERIQLGPCRGISVPVRCTAEATFKVDLSPGAPHLLYTGFRYTDDDGATVVPDSLEGLPRVGDGYRVRVFAPGVLELIPLTEHLRQILGSPYRCNTTADEYSHRRLCNA